MAQYARQSHVQFSESVVCSHFESMCTFVPRSTNETAARENNNTTFQKCVMRFARAVSGE